MHMALPHLFSQVSLLQPTTPANGSAGSPMDTAEATTHFSLTASPSPESVEGNNHMAVPEVKVRAASFDR